MTIEQLKQRQHQINGTDVAAILGFSKYKTPLDIQLEKLSDQPIIIKDNPHMKFGRMIEDTIAKIYCQEYKRKVIKPKESFQNKTYPYMWAQIDRMILNSKESGEGEGDLEIKTTNEKSYNTWDEIPDEYYCQFMHQLNCSGLLWGEFAIFVAGTKEIQRISVNRDDEFIKLMNKQLVEFWQKNIIEKIPCEARSESDLKKLYKYTDKGKTVFAVPATYEIVSKLKMINVHFKEYKQKKEELELQLKLVMQEKEILEYDGETLLTWKQDKSGVTFDLEKFKLENPEIYKKYEIEKPGNRRLLIK
jgi:putative phage-type endonuclease